jgi:hypothetical protein
LTAYFHILISAQIFPRFIKQFLAFYTTPNDQFASTTPRYRVIPSDTFIRIYTLPPIGPYKHIHQSTPRYVQYHYHKSQETECFGFGENVAFIFRTNSHTTCHSIPKIGIFIPSVVRTSNLKKFESINSNSGATDDTNQYTNRSF